jgi:hypothetical protein
VKKLFKATYMLVLAGIVMLSGIFLQTMPVVHAASQFMDYFQATPIIGSLSSSCWGAAAVGPRDQSNGLEDKTMTQYCYWDGGIIKGSDGLYHMFASRWVQSGGHNGWFGSVAVHATSSNLYGPYTDQGLCWPNNQSGKGHNVFPFVGGDGKYYIIVSDTRPGDIFEATSLNGPWTQLGTLSYSGNFGQTANISVMYRPDGRYMAVPRSGVIAISNNVLGTYVVQGTSAYVQAGVPSGNLEDPVVWYSGGKYHIVVNKWDTRKAYHITSTDGITGWTLGSGLAYDPTANFIRYTNGTVNHWNKLERLNVYIENGHVVAMTLAAIDVAKDRELGNDQHGSKVIVIPFDGAGLDSGSATPTPGPRSAFSQIEGESYDSQSGIATETCGESGLDVCNIENGDYVVYNNIDFGSGATGFQARVASATNGGNIEIRLDSTSGALLGTCSVAGTGGWQTYITKTCGVSGATGKHNLYLRFTGGSGYLFNVNWFQFTSGGVTPTPTPTATIVRTATPTPTIQTTSSPMVTKTPSPTSTRTATPQPGTPTPTPGTGAIKVQFYNQGKTDPSNQLYMNIQLVNTGSSAVALSNVKMRYWYTEDGTQAQSFWCDYSPVGSSNVTGTFVKMETAETGADTYLEIGFSSGAGSLNPGASTQVQCRCAKSDWSNYAQTNDYSFNSAASSYVDWTKMTGYVSGALQWGTEP